MRRTFCSGVTLPNTAYSSAAATSSSSVRFSQEIYLSAFLMPTDCAIVETVAATGENRRLVAVDNVGAGIGEVVLVATGSAARVGCDQENAPIDAAIVGIIDSGTGLPDLN